MFIQWRRGGRCVAAFLLTLAVSCRDATPVGPAISSPAPVGGPTSSDPATLQAETEIAVTDLATGVVYTLNIVERRIRTSRNEELVLDEQQTMEAAALFHGIMTADPTASDLLDIATADPCELPSRDGGGCSAAAARMDPSVHQRRNTPRAAAAQVWIRLGSSFSSSGRTTPERRTAPYAPALGARADGTLLNTRDMCTNIANAGLPKVLEYQRKRTKFWDDLLPYLVGEVINGGRRYFLPGSLAATKFYEIVADHAQARVAVGFLGGLWNTYQCWDRPVRVGPIILSSQEITSGSGTSSAVLRCAEVAGQISFDNKTWYDVVFIVCQYSHT